MNRKCAGLFPAVSPYTFGFGVLRRVLAVPAFFGFAALPAYLLPATASRQRRHGFHYFDV